jgi:phosphate:Na+ symporter
MNSSGSIEIVTIIFGLLGGLALFLYGMEQMTDGLKTVAGKKMKKLLSRMTSNRFKGATTGAFVTAVIQSSSVTTVLLVGFISAGLLQLKQAISIIMGANIGTTFTVQIIAFKVTELALLMIAVGFALKFFVKQEKIKYLGLMLMGFGLIFLGMNLMSDATHPLRTYEPFILLMQQIENPFIGIFIAAGFTAIIQSSAATIGIVIALATQGFISLEAGIALTFGANIGTCITAALASIGTPREAKQAALVHVLFNIFGVLIWLPFLDRFAELVYLISPSSPELTGIFRMAADAPRQIANAHTIFNIGNTFIFIWLATPLARLVASLLPSKPVVEPAAIKPKYISDIYLDTPELALERVRMELGREGKRVLRMVKEFPEPITTGNKEKLKSIKKMDNDVDALHEFILAYLAKLSKEELTSYESNMLQGYLSAANYIENIGDVIETNLVTLGRERVKRDIEFDNAFEIYMNPFYNIVYWSSEQAIKGLVEGDKLVAEKVIDAKPEVWKLADNALDFLSQKLNTEKDLPLSEFRIQADIIENTKRIYYLSKRLAKVVTEMQVQTDQLKIEHIQEELPFGE